MNKKKQFKLRLNKNRGEYLIFSFPQSNHYQLISNLFFKPNIYKFINDNRFKNRIGVFRLNDVKQNIVIQFKHQPKAINWKIDKKLTLDDYQKEILNNNFLKPDSFVNGHDKKILQFTEKIIGKEKNLLKIITQLYSFTLKYLSYGKPIEGLCSYKQAIEERITDCGGFSTFLASLLQSVGIPSRLVVGFLIKKDLLSRILTFNFSLLTFNLLLIHAWLEILLPDESWFPLDPSIEWRRKRGLTKRLGGFGFIPDDRLVVSFGEDFKLKIDNKIYQIDLLQNPVYV